VAAAVTETEETTLKCKIKEEEQRKARSEFAYLEVKERERMSLAGMFRCGGEFSKRKEKTFAPEKVICQLV